jgi:uroporphyrinogen-III synthase
MSGLALSLPAVPALFETIRKLVSDRRYVVGQHAAERLEERGILEWQVVDGIGSARLIVERPLDRPNPSVMVMQLLADGSDVTVVWSHITAIDVAKLVTVYFPDE